MDKLKVLVVAELDSLGRLISYILNRIGFDVNVVDTSRYIKETYVEIHAELSRKNYDMVLLTNNGLRPSDIQALIPEIKKKHPAIKIFVLSGFSTPEFVRDLKEQGIDDFLSLPFAHDDLVQKVISIFDEENEVIKEAQKKLICEVIGYDGDNYWVSFSHRGRRVAIKSIPRKEIDDLKMGVKNFSYLKELLGWLEQVAQEKGKS